MSATYRDMQRVSKYDQGNIWQVAKNSTFLTWCEVGWVVLLLLLLPWSLMLLLLLRQDREIRFDSPSSYLELRKGEFAIDSMDSVEDTKGT